MQYLVRTGVVVCGLMLALAWIHASGPIAAAQTPEDVPWSDVPPELKDAIRVQAEAIGRPFALIYSGSCAEAGQRGQLCASVVRLEGDRSRVAIGLWRSEVTFFNFVRSDGRWVLGMAPPPTGTGAVPPSSRTNPGALYLLGAGFLSLSVVLGLVARRKANQANSAARPRRSEQTS